MNESYFDIIARTVRGVIQSREGGPAVEFALLAPLLTGILVPIADIGRYAYEKMEVQLAGQSGVEYAAKNGRNPAGIQQAILSAAPSLPGLTAIPGPPSQPTDTFDAAHILVCGCTTGNDSFQSVSCTSGETIPGCPTASDPPGHVYVSVGAKATFTPLFNYPWVAVPQTVSWTAFARISS